MTDSKWLTTEELEAGLEAIRQSPTDVGAVAAIVRRPISGEREVLAEAGLDWRRAWWATIGWCGSRHTPDGSAHPDMQLTVMNARTIALVARTKDRWQLAGDQLYIDLDLSVGNLPPGTQLAVGDAVIEVTSQSHTGCKHFAARFGADATRFVNSRLGKQLRLRGINARIVRPGKIRIGDAVKKLPA